MTNQFRNLCVARGTINNDGGGSVYLVPLDHVLLLKSLLAYNPGANTVSYGWIIVSREGVSTPWLTTSQLVTGKGEHVETWLALNAGDSITLYTSAHPVVYWISGALLPTAAGTVGVELHGRQVLNPPRPPDANTDDADFPTQGTPTPIPFPPA